MFGGAERSPEAVGTLPQENKIFDLAANWTQAVLLCILSLHYLSRPSSTNEHGQTEQCK